MKNTELLELEDHPLWWHLQGRQETATGYGQRLTTRYKVRHNGRLYRVYATCISNVSSNWIEAKGVKIYISDVILRYIEKGKNDKNG